MASSTYKPPSKSFRASTRPQSTPQSKAPPSLSSHLAMVELKSRIISSVSKLADRDTHQIAVSDLEKIIRSLPSNGFPMLLSSLLHDPVPSPGDLSGVRNSPVVARRESIRLISLLCSLYPDAAVTHLPKIIAIIVRRLKDPVADSSLRDACCGAAGTLAEIYLRSEADGGHSWSTASMSHVAGLFLKPLLEVMGEQSKTVQAGAAMCLAKVVEGGGGGEGTLFQRLCPRICKMIGSQSFLAKGPLLSVISNLAQVGAISSQNMPTVLQHVRKCLENSDWATRKAAADTLNMLASRSNHLITEETYQTIASLEACRFDKVKLVRDSMVEALQLWKRISGNGEDGTLKSLQGPTVDESGDGEGKEDNKNLNLNIERLESVNDLSADSSSNGSGSLSNRLENTADLLKIKAPSLKDKELNPEFFQKLESRIADDLPVEVVLPHRWSQTSHSKDVKEKSPNYGDPWAVSDHMVAGCELKENLAHSSCRYNTTEGRLGAHGRQQNSDFPVQDRFTEPFLSRNSKQRAFCPDSMVEISLGKSFAGSPSISRTGLVESSFMISKENWLGIQRQLSHLERQQAQLMNMLQKFTGGSHNSLIKLENRVHGLERVVEEMAQSVSFGWRGRTMMMGFEGSPRRSFSNYNGLQGHPASMFGQGGGSRIPYRERYNSSDDMVSVARGREPWRSESEKGDSNIHIVQRNGNSSGRKGLVSFSSGGRLPRNEHGGNQVSSVWQASKDEVTLKAIRVDGEGNGTSHAVTRWPLYEADMKAKAVSKSQEGGPVWDSWTYAMNLLQIGDMDSAYAEVLSIGDDVLLVKLMERSGPVINELSGGVATEVLHVVGQFLPEQRLSHIALPWIRQLMDLITENGAEFACFPIEVKRGILQNLREASLTTELREDGDGASADKLMVQLASAWGIDDLRQIR